MQILEIITPLPTFRSAVKALQLSWQDGMSIVIAASQKSLAVALSVVVFLPDSIGDAGLISVAAIIAQIVQIAYDSALIVKIEQITTQIEAAQRESAQQVGSSGYAKLRTIAEDK